MARRLRERPTSAAIDTANGKLLVVTTKLADSGSTPALFRCNLDGSACTYTDLSAGPVAVGGSALIDAASGKLLVVTVTGTNAVGSPRKPALLRCNLDGSACTYADISAGQIVGSGSTSSAVIDAASAKLLVVAATGNGLNGYKSGLFRCNLDGSACTYADISAGQGAHSGTYPSAVIDAANGTLLVATDNAANSDRPALVNVCLP